MIFKNNIWDTSNQNYILPVVILLIITIYRVIISLLLYGGGDSSNVQSFSILYDFNIDIYSINAHWPYFPFASSFLIFCNYLSNFILLETIQIYKIITTVFEFFIALIIFNYQKIYFNTFKSALIASIYLLSPISIIIISILGFNDVLFIYFFILALFHLKDENNNFLSLIFLSLSISIKPVTIIFIPYFLYKSKNVILSFLIIILSLIIFNFYFVFQFGFSSFINLFSEIIYKLVFGYQKSSLGIGYFEFIFGFDFLKIFTIFGILISLSLYIYLIDENKFFFVYTIFLIIILFRYNTHPQYFIWSIPFLFLTHRWKHGILFSFLSGLTVTCYLFHWDGNGGAFSMTSNLSYYFSPNSILISDFILNLTSYIYPVLNIITLVVGIYIVQLKVIKNSILCNLSFLFNFIKSIKVLRILFLIFLLVPFFIFIIRLNFEIHNSLNIKQLTIFWFCPIFLIGLLSIIKNTLLNKYLYVFIFFIFFSYFFVNSLKFICFLMFLFLVISFKEILKNHYFISNSYAHSE